MCRCFGHEENSKLRIPEDEAISAVSFSLCKENPGLDPVKAVEMATTFVKTARNLRIEIYKIEGKTQYHMESKTIDIDRVGSPLTYQGGDPYRRSAFSCF